MKRTILAALFCLVPARAFAQPGKLLDIQVPDEKPAAVVQAPKAQAAEIIPVIEPTVKKPAAAAAARPAAAAAVKEIARPRYMRDRNADALPSGFRAGNLVVLPKEEKPSGGFKVLKRHKVTSGDTLWDLSATYYKDPFMWGRIYNANFSSVADPDLIYPKDELVIPDITELLIPYRKPAARAAAEDEAYVYAPPAVSKRKAAAPGPGEILVGLDRDFLSEEMPEHQTEWGDGAKIVPDSWREDGVIAAILDNDDSFLEDTLSLDGSLLELSLEKEGLVRPGDYMAVYMKGADAYDKSGKRLGLEVQPVGIAEVLSVDGGTAKARVVDATSGIAKGYIVKKR